MRFHIRTGFSNAILAVVLIGLFVGPVCAASVDTALTAFRDGYFELAARELEIILDEEPDNLSALYWLGRCKIATGAAAAAESHFRRVLQKKPQSVESRYWLGEALAAQGLFEDALAMLQSVLELDTDHSAATKASERIKATPQEIEQFDAGGFSGFTASGLDTSVTSAELFSRNVYDYTFSRAPTDWLIRSGEWNATSRWTCSPQWSWFGGYELDGLAAIWNKREFVGDIVVEIYAAFKMRLHRNPTYLPPNDVNITICGDGANPDSGYSFIIGGYNNTVTMITKGTEILAQTSDPEALWPITENGRPSTYEWHRKWWGIRVHKRGGTLQLYLDNRLVLEAHDDEPIRQGHVGVWVLDNDLITPRIKVYYEDEHDVRSPMSSPQLVQAPEETAPVVVTSKSHQSIQNGFEAGLGKAETRDGDQGALLALDDREAGRCLKLVNQAAGGSFGATLFPGSLSAKQMSRLSFDYRIPPDTRVNLYLTHRNEVYEIGFTGPDEPAPTCLWLGQIENVVADGKWHHAQFDLLGHLQALHPGRSEYECSDLWVGNAGNSRYLQAGFGANRMNATWWLDDLYLGHGAGDQLQVVMSAVGQKVPGCAVSVDRDPLGEPPMEVNCTEQAASFDLEGEGTWYLHVRPKISEDEWGPLVHYRAECDKTPPAVVEQTPKPDTPIADRPIRLRLEDESSGVDLSSLAVKVNDRKLSLDGSALSWEPQQETLVVDPARAGVIFEDGASASFEISGLRDRAGNEADPVTYAYPVNFKEDHSPPSVPQISIADGYLIDDDFEDGLGEWSAYGGDDTRLYLDDTTWADGQRSVRIESRKIGGRFGARITRERFQAGKHRIVSFDYRADDRVRADFAVYVNGDLKGIRFLDNDSNIGVIGEIPDIVADDQWHHAEFNLYEMLKKDDPDAETYQVRQFLLGDWGQTGSRIGASYHIDNFRVIPVVSGREPVEVTWRSADASGIEGIAWEFMDTRMMPSREVRETASPFELNLPDTWRTWLVARPRDRAGNWGDSAARQLLVDSQIPYSNVSAPQEGTVTATSEISLILADKGPAEIDPTSVVLQVDGKKYSTDNAGLRYHRGPGRLIWNCENISPAPVVFKDGQTVPVKLVQAADYAGNMVADLPEWSWKMSYAADSDGPPIREIESPTHPVVIANTFEDGTEQWQSRGGEDGGLVSHDTSTAASGKGSLKLTNRSRGGDMSALICREPFSAEKHNIVSFDYNIPEGVSIDFQFHMEGRWWPVTLTDSRRQAIGSVSGVKADGQWHHASFDIGKMLRQRKNRGSLTVQYVIVGDRDNMDNKQGAVAHFDNFVIGQVGTKKPTLRWKATDCTGIEAFSYALDQSPDTVPDTSSEGLAVAKEFAAPKPGVWFFHLRAQDGAGNWGPTRTYTLMHEKP